MSLLDDVILDLECASIVASPLFLQTLAIVYAARKAGILADEQACNDVDLKGLVTDSGVDVPFAGTATGVWQKCACRVAFATGGSSAALNPPGSIQQADSTSFPISAASFNPNSLDVFQVKSGTEQFQTASWGQDILFAQWGTWSQIPGLEATGFEATAPLTVLSRGQNLLDVFFVGSDGNVHTAATDRRFDRFAPWQGWWQIPGIGGVAGGSEGAVAAVSRDPNMLDVFVVGGDGGIHTAAWNFNIQDAQWLGWWLIPGDVTFGQGSQITAVSRTSTSLDVFVVDADSGQIFTATWDQNVNDAQWTSWTSLLGGIGIGPLAAVSRDPGTLDVFVVGGDVSQSIWWATWDPNGGWQGWNPIADGPPEPGPASGDGLPSTVAALSRSSDTLDVFVTGMAGGIYTTSWNSNDGVWQPWSSILGGVSGGLNLVAVSRDPSKVDLFVVGPDGVVYTAARDDNSGGEWGGWWPIE
jgi:hypothetical protein